MEKTWKISGIMLIAMLSMSMAGCVFERPSESTFRQSYTYRACRYDNRESARAIAIASVYGKLLGEAGRALGAESDSAIAKLCNGNTARVQAATAVTQSMEIVGEAWDSVSGRYTVSAEMAVDRNEALHQIGEILKNRDKIIDALEVVQCLSNHVGQIEQLRGSVGKHFTAAQVQSYRQAATHLQVLEWVLRGHSAAVKKHYRRALLCYRRAASIDSGNAKVYDYMGAMYEKERDRIASMRCFRRSIALDSSYVKGYYSLGCAYAQVGRYDEAIGLLRKAIEIKPSYAHHEWAQCCQYKGQHAVSASFLRDAVSLTTYYTSMSCLALGSCYLALDDDERALRSFRQAIAANPQEPESYLYIGSIYTQRGYYDRAIALYQRILFVCDDALYTMRVLDKLAKTFYQKGLWSNSQSAIDTAIEYYTCLIGMSSGDEPAMPHRYHELGTMYLAQQKYAEAISSYEHTIQLDSGDMGAYTDMGRAYAGMGNYAKAIENVKVCLSQVPTDTAALAVLAEIYKSCGEYRLAENVSSDGSSHVLEHQKLKSQ